MPPFLFTAFCYPAADKIYISFGVSKFDLEYSAGRRGRLSRTSPGIALHGQIYQ